MEIWDGSRLIASASTNMQNWTNVVLTAHVEGGARYEIRILGGEWTTVTMEWPN